MATYIVQAALNPSVDFYFPQRDVSYDISHKVLPNTLNISETDKVVFIRYIPKVWYKYLNKLSVKKRPAIVFFMDDDLFDLSMHKGLPWRYRWKLYFHAGRYQSWLKKMQAQLWVSTPWLAAKYQDWQPVCIAPQNPYSMQKPQKTIFYHGSASHMAEIKWLVPVIEQVLKVNKQLNFEIIGTKKVRDLFKHIDRVYVVHPMSWDSYRAFISTPGRIIGLAPLLDTAFNNARAATKFYDITQAGAVGIYADHPVYREAINHRNDKGYLVSMEQRLWVEKILSIARYRE